MTLVPACRGYPSPRFMEAVRWMNSTGSLLQTYGPVPKITSEDQWRGWFLNMLNNPAMSLAYLPNPYGFKDWRSCAERFYQALDGANL